MSITTPITQLLNIQHPIMLAGMNFVAGAKLAAAVSNAGGLGVIGGGGYTPDQLREMITDLKKELRDPNLPFGVDVLLPQVGGSARKTNYDYLKGNLDKVIDVVIEEGTTVFVSAVGVPPKFIVDKLHKGGVLYMNMIGHPKHVHKACQIGADLICAQGGEAGGHTGEIATSVLIPACADICKQYTSPMTKHAVQLVAAGGIADGRGLAAALMYGASAVWIGTRFVTAKEAMWTEAEKRKIIEANFDSTIKSTIWTGRPLRNLRSPYIEDWEKNRQAELEALQAKGILPLQHDLDKLEKDGNLTEEIEDQARMRPCGQVSGLVNKADQSAAEIVQEISSEAYALLNEASKFVKPTAKL